MNDWRVRRCYGRGAGRIAVAARPLRPPSDRTPFAAHLVGGSSAALLALLLVFLAGHWPGRHTVLVPTEIALLIERPPPDPVPAAASPPPQTAVKTSPRVVEAPVAVPAAVRAPSPSPRPRPQIGAVAAPPAPVVLPSPDPLDRPLASVSSGPPRSLSAGRVDPIGPVRVARARAIPDAPSAISAASLPIEPAKHPVVSVPVAPTATAKRDARRALDVPLHELAACRSDREEDLLKQRVLATVRQQVECNSDAGSYRFVEMKNLNAFLLSVQRSPDRDHGNRCEELRHALHCLGANSRESRS